MLLSYFANNYRRRRRRNEKNLSFMKNKNISLNIQIFAGFLIVLHYCKFKMVKLLAFTAAKMNNSLQKKKEKRRIVH